MNSICLKLFFCDLYKILNKEMPPDCYICIPGLYGFHLTMKLKILM